MLRQILTLLFSRGSILVSTFLVGVILARGMTVEERGLYAYIVSLVAILVPLSELGLRQYTILKVNEGKVDLSIVKSSSQIFFISFLCISIGSSLILENYVLVLLLVLLTVIMNYTQGLFLATSNYKYFALINHVKAIVHILIVGCYFFWADSISSIHAVLSLSVALFFCSILSTFVLRANNLLYNSSYRYSKLETIKLSYHHCIGFFLVNFSYKSVVFCYSYNSGSDLGYIAILMTLSELIWQVPMAFSTWLLGNKNNPININKSILFVGFYASVATIILTLFGDYFIAFVYGSKYSGTMDYIRLFSLYIVCVAVFKVIYMYEAKRNRNLAISLPLACGCLMILIISYFNNFSSFMVPLLFSSLYLFIIVKWIVKDRNVQI
ncbi:lipopolysaccharide biosynthesis protein [Vibrio splendidus]|uniref:lipopolysaccharide biosynthesis protein n=1 Tax=Vibrio splendidus TaxID=29497 RepID=UPI000D34E7F9|nr:hypothetical protein [Vibrio splendidus]PTP48081.1 hypothetical protein CWO05_23205 [Vibrio splendidus]